MISLFHKTPNFRLITLHKRVKYRRFQRTCEQFSEHCLCITLENSSTYITLSVINPLSANSQNGQTHSNNSSANCRRIVWVYLTILWDWHLKVNCSKQNSKENQWWIYSFFCLPRKKSEEIRLGNCYPFVLLY